MARTQSAIMLVALRARASVTFQETLMNALCRENTHGHSQSQSNGDQRRVDALPRLIKQRVVIAPVRKMQMQSESLQDAHRACVPRHMLRYSAVEFAHTATACLRTHTHTHSYAHARARTHTPRTAGDASSSPRVRRICMNSKSIDHTPGTILA